MFLMFENLGLTLAKKRCEWECNKTIISENFCVFHLLRHLATTLKCLLSNWIKLTFVGRHLLKNAYVDIASEWTAWANRKNGKSWSILQEDKKWKWKHPQTNRVQETENVKWCVFKVPQYSCALLSLFCTHLINVAHTNRRYLFILTVMAL